MLVEGGLGHRVTTLPADRGTHGALSESLNKRLGGPGSSVVNFGEVVGSQPFQRTGGRTTPSLDAQYLDQHSDVEI